MIDEAKKRVIRSFVLRAGRMTEAQDKAYQTLWDEYGLVCQHQRLDLRKTFGRDAQSFLRSALAWGIHY